MFPEKIKIEVTWDDINNGIPGCGQRCMLAKAVTRTLLNSPLRLSSVGRSWVYILYASDREGRCAMKYYKIPSRAFHKARMFDRHRRTIEPFNFVLTKED